MLHWLATFGWASAIWVLSSRPMPEMPSLSEIPYWDKFLHFVAFAVGGFLLASALQVSTQWKWRRVFVVSFIGIALYGALDEWHQLYTPGRSGGDVFDWLADLTGAMVGALSARPIYGRIRQFAAEGCCRTNPEPAGGD
jgi:VanZ family protein